MLLSGRRAQSVKRDDLSTCAFASLLTQRFIADLIAETANHRCNLRVEQRLRNNIAQMTDDFQILPRRVKNLQDTLISHEVEKRLKLDAIGHRVDDGFVFTSSHLNETKLRPEGPLAHELGIDGNELVLFERVAQLDEPCRCIDYFHWISVTEAHNLSLSPKSTKRHSFQCFFAADRAIFMNTGEVRSIAVKRPRTFSGRLRARMRQNVMPISTRWIMLV